MREEVFQDLDGKEVKIPFQTLNANLKIQLNNLKKKQNSETNDLFTQFNTSIAKVQSIGNMTADEQIELDKSPEMMKLKESINFVDMMVKANSGDPSAVTLILADAVNSELEVPQLLEYIKTCIDMKAVKDKKVIACIDSEEFWNNVSTEKLEELKNSFCGRRK